jgi:hypothetical protein
VALDWKRLLTGQGIPFQDAGPHNINTACPFCGAVDVSGHYLAISLRGRGWRCFRNPRQHRGRSYVRLLTALLRCTQEHARELLGETATPLPEPDHFAEQWRSQLGLSVPSRLTTLEFPAEFTSMASPSRFGLAFWYYLYNRGFSTAQADWAVASYNLHYATTGQYTYRLIIPVYSAQGKLMTWTGRSIRRDTPIRYLSLGTDDALAPPGDLLLGLPLLWKATSTRCLVICEGPFDAIAVTVLGHQHGIWGTCLFGVNVSEAQANLLAELERRFDQMTLLVDPDARLRTLSLRERLPQRCGVSHLPFDLKDPGELLQKGYNVDELQIIINTRQMA